MSAKVSQKRLLILFMALILPFLNSFQLFHSSFEEFFNSFPLSAQYHAFSQMTCNFFQLKSSCGGFPGGTVVESLPANSGDTGSSPGLGGFHMLRSSQAREPQLLSLCVWSLCSAAGGRDSERPAHCDEEWPPLAAGRESPRTEMKTQDSHKIIAK